jgi:hypothetical protein
MHITTTRARFLLVALATVATLPVASQDLTAMPPDSDPDLSLEKSPFSGLLLGGRYIHRNFDERHDALLNRNDYDSSQYDNWEKGYVKGNANGIELNLAKQGGGTLFGHYLAEESHYEWRAPEGYHRVESDGHEIQLGWRQIAETKDDGHWGWTAGYVGSKADKWMETQERSAFQPYRGDVQWDMLQVGYFGEWKPLLPWLYFFGNIGGRFGEVEGLCRRDSDPDWKDGSIGERYIVDSSLAYGAYANVGFGVTYRNFAVDIRYFRSWMYSFAATESGTVVFPDNDDALFIQNDGGFEFRAGYTSSF